LLRASALFAAANPRNTSETGTFDKLARGAYYIELGKCADCHTPLDDDNQPLPGMDFAGGNYLEGQIFST